MNVSVSWMKPVFALMIAWLEVITPAMSSVARLPVTRVMRSTRTTEIPSHSQVIRPTRYGAATYPRSFQYTGCMYRPSETFHSKSVGAAKASASWEKPSDTKRKPCMISRNASVYSMARLV